MELIIWGILCVVLFIAEALSCQLISIWFAAGSLAAFFVTLAGGGRTLQLVVFILVSTALLVVTRPILKKMLPGKIEATNADLDIGERATILEEVNNSRETGRARRNGIDWIAVSATGEVIPEGTVVIIKEVDGAKLLVEPETSTKQTF